MTIRIEVDFDRCTGLGLCEAEAPDFFEVQDDGSLLVLSETAEADRRTQLEAAVASCPTEALRLVED